MCDMLQGDFCLWIRIAKPGNKNKWLVGRVGLHSATCTVTHEKESAEIVGEMAMMAVGGVWQDDYW